MNESRQIRLMVQDIVNWYATYSRDDRCFVLNVSDIPENDLNNLAGLIISQSDDYASEATGFDNADFERSMRPALVVAMRKQKNGYLMEVFHDAWVSGVRSYLIPCMTKLIDSALEDFNGEKGCNMELVYDRATEKVIEIRSRM